MKNYLSHSFWKIYTAGKKNLHHRWWYSNLLSELISFDSNVGHGCLCLNLLSELIALVMLVMVVFHPVGRLDWWSNDATSIIVTWSEENKQGILFNRRLLFFNLNKGGGRSTSRASDLHLHMRANKGSLHIGNSFSYLYFLTCTCTWGQINKYTRIQTT